MEETNREILKEKMFEYFPGKVVRKDLTKSIKEGANVPVYVLEYLLGMYCSTDDDDLIVQGVNRVKSILENNYVRPDEAQKIISKLRQEGSHTVIDKLTVRLDYQADEYVTEFSNLGLTGVPISEDYPHQFERLLSGGIWCIVQLEYYHDELEKSSMPFSINKVTPIQMPHIDMEEFKESRSEFTKDEWIDLILRTTGMEPEKLNEREKWLHLLRLVPLVENNYNLCELGPRGTGKSHIYKEISPNSILVSGGQTTVANLFYNMSSRTVGLVGMWDTVAFDEVAGIRFKDKDGIQIMKDFMASGSFARGKEEKNANASFAFVGNINQSVDVLLKTSHLFEPFPQEMGQDTAFLDRMHAYLPGWEIPKYRPHHFTDDFAFITDYYSEIMRELRKTTYADAIEKYFKLGNDLNQRDTIGVKRTVSGMIKIIYPHGEFIKEDVEEVLVFALEMRRRVKEQLKKIGGMEFYDVKFSYTDLDDFTEHYVTVPEQGSSTLIPDGQGKPGHLYFVAHGNSGMIGTFKLETQITSGNGKFTRTGIGSNATARESMDNAFRYLKSHASKISNQISTTNKDYIVNAQDLNGVGHNKGFSLAGFIAMVSAALGKPVLSSLAIVGELTIGGTIVKEDNLANILQVCKDAGAKRVLIPQTSAMDLGTVPPELLSSFNLIFYNTGEDAVFKALGVE